VSTKSAMRENKARTYHRDGYSWNSIWSSSKPYQRRNTEHLSELFCWTLAHAPVQLPALARVLL